MSDDWAAMLADETTADRDRLGMFIKQRRNLQNSKRGQADIPAVLKV
jgi:hypothetical protein